MIDLKPIQNPNRLINYWKKEVKALIIVFFSGIIYNVGILAGPILQGKLIDELLLDSPLIRIVITALIFVSVITILQLVRYVKRFYIRRFANNTSNRMRLMIYNNIVHKQEKQLNDENMGNLMTKSIADVDACVEGMRKFTTEIFDSGVLLVAHFVALCVYDIKLTILCSVFTPVAMYCAEKMKKIIYGYTMDYRKSASEIAGLTYDRLENIALYRITGREKENLLFYNKKLSEYEKKAIIANVWENSMQPVYNMISLSGVIFVIVIGSKYVLQGKWSVGELSAYLTLFSAMAFKASKTSKLFNSVQKAKVSWIRIKPYFEEYQDLDQTIGSNHEQNINDFNENTESVLSVQGLSFCYKNDEMLFTNLNFSLEMGQWIGITGPVASGKSTFGKLFLGEYNYAGSVCVFGNEIRNTTGIWRSKHIGYLGHEPHLISDTIYHNITLGVEGNIEEVIKQVCMDDEIEKMENGIHTYVGNGGVCLSGGQQARIALARLLYHNPEIFVLDDPFSAVDRKTEDIIMNNLRLIKKEHIILLISHRLKNFDQLDKVLVLNQLDQWEFGTHSNLLASSQLYGNLYGLQQMEGENL